MTQSAWGSTPLAVGVWLLIIIFLVLLKEVVLMKATTKKQKRSIWPFLLVSVLDVVSAMAINLVAAVPLLSFRR